MAIHDEDPTRPPSGSMATASLVIGLVSLVACGLGIVAGPVAVVLGIVSGRRTGFRSKEIGGIASGALAFVTTAVVMIGLLVYAARDDGPTTTNAFVTPDASATPTIDPSPEGGVTLTEAGIAASGFDTAYAAYLSDNGVTDALDGIYAGGVIDTPCFSMDGAAWWVVQGEPATCEPRSELWWETYSDSSDPEIKLFGSGAAGSAISFEALKTEFLMTRFNSTDLQPVSDYVRDTLLPESGATDIVETPIELGGLPAVQFDCSIGELAAYRLDVVILPSPRTLDDGTEITGFIIHAYNEAEWVYKSDDVFARLDNSLVWK